jgi:transposase InsO family protein
LFLADAPDRIWVSDITCLPLADGEFGYPGMWMDLFSRYIVGWQQSPNMEEHLTSQPLAKALQWRKPLPGLILNSDREPVPTCRGGQYVAANLRSQIKKHHQSMSRKDNCYDNAFAESFFGRFKPVKPTA